MPKVLGVFGDSGVLGARCPHESEKSEVSYWRTLFRSLFGLVVDPKFSGEERELIAAFAKAGNMTPAEFVRTYALRAVPVEFSDQYWTVRNNKQARRELEVKTRIYLPMVTSECAHWSKGPSLGSGLCNHPSRNTTCYFSPSTRVNCVDYKKA